MDSSSQDGEGKKKVTEIKIFSVPFALGEIQENITINTKTPSKPSKEQIINKAFKFHPSKSLYQQYFSEDKEAKKLLPVL